MVLGIGQSEEKMKSLIEELSYLRDQFKYWIFDVSQEENWNTFREELTYMNINVDLLINNAGMLLPFEKSVNYTEEQVKRCMDVNFNSCRYSINAMLPILRKSTMAGIVNVSSSGALAPLVGTGVYSASKAAVKAYTETLIGELGREMYIGYVLSLIHIYGETKTIKYSPEIEKRYIVGMQYAPSDTEAEITQVTRGSAFFKAGVQAGDVVTEIDGTAIKTGNDMNDYLTEHPFGENEVKITLDRKGKTVNVTVKPIMTKIASRGFDYNIGREKQSIGGVIKYSFTDVRYEIATVLKSLKMLVTGKVSANEIAGPVGIVNVIGNTYSTAKSQGTTVTILSLINLAIMLSANLGVMNLLPLPALDGGRLFLYIIEIITRKKIPKDKEGMIHFIGFILLMALMVDVYKRQRWHRF